ncbi:hypothetical protein ACFOD0_11515 [Shewanella intestini]|uniref:Uncharacterized protein n=1 Tax=Shewanella intestini TaxID=2017544 RepID=A0ABS5I313_9GAMM|nr:MULTISPECIES: hypothetical protein [Shewanella]MBR9728411.1 hypothetical protein [Shewanella intestini]MRG36753.1 hypothetical protein [Shewanella sp. XMDDZSB0408]
MSAGTLSDYSEDMYEVYFEVADEAVLTILSEFVGSKHAESIVVFPFGYQVAMPIQCIPEIVNYLSQKNIAIYQVIRGDKTDGIWR